MKLKRKTVSEKVHDMLANENESSDESLADISKPKVTEFDEDEYEQPEAQITEFRKRNIKLLSEQHEKYSGEIAFRKDFEAEDNENESDFYEDSDESNNELEQILQSSDEDIEPHKSIVRNSKHESNADSFIGEEEEEIVNSFESESAEGEEEENEENKDGTDNEEENEPLISETNLQKEIEKGICVQNQLSIWERLLEIRINSQKLLTKANQLPEPKSYLEIPNIEEVKKETCTNIANLLAKLCKLKQTFITQNSEAQEKVKDSQPLPTTKDIIEEENLFAAKLQENFENFREYRNNVLLKWDDRTKLLTPGIGNKRKSAQEDYDVVKKITHALNNSQALIKRSQVLHIQPNNEQQQQTVEPQRHIYDDSDFYHQQLRELIESKANSNSNTAEVTRQYVELQKIRQKMKKKVDTRASKGRKIR